MPNYRSFIFETNQMNRLKFKKMWALPLMYLGTFLAACSGAVWVHELAYSDLKYPWRVLDSDLSSVYSIAQALEQSWTGTTNAFLGAPFKADFSLVFLIEDLHLFFIRILVHVTHDPFIAVNTFYILTFGMSAISFLFVSRRLNTKTIFAVPLALSYAWLPYHFSRMDVGHVSLAGYYMLPIGVLILHRLFGYLTHESEHFLPRNTTLKTLLVIAIVLVGSSGSYYGLFFSLLTFSLLLLLISCRSEGRLIRRICGGTGVAIGFIVAPVLRTVLARLNGLDDSVIRNPEESVQFGGSITRLLIPWGTWLPMKLKPAVSLMEYEWNATPFLGSIGVWLLLIVLGLKVAQTRDMPISIPRSLAYLFPWGLLLYAAGGLGLVFAYLVDPSFRAWNRLSIVILTLSLLALGSALSKIKRAGWLMVATLLILTIFTQLTPLSSVGIAAEPDPISKAAYDSLQEDANSIEQLVTPGCSILQLPIMLYPEGVPVGDVGNGEHLWLPLLSKDLRWSYGAGKGTAEGKYWGEFFGANPLLPIQRARELGFCAVVVNFQSNLDRDEIIGILGQPVYENSITRNTLFLIGN